MRKIGVLLICLAVIISLFSVNNATSSFSFENYLTEISQVAENRPSMPDTEKIDKVILEYELNEDEEDSSKILVVLKSVWTTIKLIYECIVFAVRFLLYIFEMLVYVIKIVCACTYNLLVW